MSVSVTSGHATHANECPLSGVKRASLPHRKMSALTQSGHRAASWGAVLATCAIFICAQAAPTMCCPRRRCDQMDYFAATHCCERSDS